MSLPENENKLIVIRHENQSFGDVINLVEEALKAKFPEHSAAFIQNFYLTDFLIKKAHLLVNFNLKNIALKSISFFLRKQLKLHERKVKLKPTVARSVIKFINRKESNPFYKWEGKSYLTYLIPKRNTKFYLKAKN